jgi:hypothetical protein
MKIKSINASESHSHGLALNTEPEMSSVILERTRLDWANDAILKNFIPSIAQNHILKIVSLSPISLNVPTGLIPALEKVLSEAEQSAIANPNGNGNGDALSRLNEKMLHDLSQTLGIPVA